MFEAGDYVLNAKNGICRVEGTVTLDASISNSNDLYYLLIPLEEANAKTYIPVDGAEQRMRLIIDEQKAWSIIDSIPKIEEIDIQSDKEREKQYKEAIQSWQLHWEKRKMKCRS